MESKRLLANEVFDQAPLPWPEDVTQSIRESLTQKIVVLDDDPTGTQTVHGVPVLTEWSIEVLAAEFDNDLPAFYILTNSRSLLPAEAQALNTEIGRNLKQAAAGREFAVISRSDSTLRGHFPGEVQALAAALDQDFDAWLLIPFFEEGGRYTIDDTHYVMEAEWLIPAGQTPYAQDATFGYQSSNLRDWVIEKMGSVPVESISLKDIREGGPDQVEQRLTTLTPGSVCIVNALSRRDLDVFTVGLLAAERQGRRFLYRTAASFVASRVAIQPKPLLTATELNLPETGGTVYIVGSYVPKTGKQIEHLMKQTDVTSIEV